MGTWPENVWWGSVCVVLAMFAKAHRSDEGYNNCFGARANSLRDIDEMSPMQLSATGGLPRCSYST
eukprot:1939333-Pleurochrysis_carterae.AAC.1